MREKHFKDEKTDEELLACRDDRVPIEDWEWLITFWRSEEFKVKHITNLPSLIYFSS